MTESTSEYKKRIEEIKQSIENEPYMAKMREDIAEGISKTGIRQATVEEQFKDVQDHYEATVQEKFQNIDDQFQAVVENTTGKDVISAPEIIVGRGGYATLGERLDADKSEVGAQLAQIALNVKAFGAKGDGSDCTQAFKDAVNGLPGTGGTILVPSGDYVLSDTWLIPSNTTVIISDGATIKPANDFIGKQFSQYATNIRTIITNADHVNGNENVHITGKGTVTGEGVSLNLNVSWVGVWLDNCRNSTIEGLRVSHFGYEIPAENAYKYFATLLTMCDDSIMKNIHASHTGDDCIRVSSGSQNCKVIDCIAHNPKFGHTFQAVGDYHIFSAPRPTKNIEFINITGYDTDQKEWSESGCAFHTVEGGSVKQATFRNTGAGVVLLGDTSNILIDDIKGYDIATYVVYLNGYYGNLNHIDVKNIKTELVDGDTTIAGVRIYTTNGYTVENFTVDNVNVKGAVEYAVGIIATTTGTIQKFTISNIIAEGYKNQGVITSASGSSIVKDGYVKDAILNSSLAGTRGVYLNGGNQSDLTFENIKGNDIGEYFAYLYASGTTMKRIKFKGIESNKSATGTGTGVVRVFAINSAIVEDLEVSSITGNGEFNYAVALLTDTSGQIKGYSIDKVIATGFKNQGIIVQASGTVRNIVDGVINGNILKSTYASSRGIYLSTVGETIVSSNRVSVSGQAFVELGSCDYNMFSGNNGRGSGTATPTLVGTNSQANINIV